jgi:hypothetical protein
MAISIFIELAASQWKKLEDHTVSRATTFGGAIYNLVIIKHDHLLHDVLRPELNTFPI